MTWAILRPKRADWFRGFLITAVVSMVVYLVAAWWATIAVSASVLRGPSAAPAIGVLFLLPIAAMSFRWRSVRLGVYSVVAWNVYALSFLPGFIRSRVSPTSRINSTVLKQGPVAERAPPAGDHSTTSIQGCARAPVMLMDSK